MNLQAVYKLYSENINLLDNKPWENNTDNKHWENNTDIKTSISIRYCSCFKYNETLYLITMAHDLSYETNDYLDINTSRIQLDKSKKIIIPEIDIMIYPINENLNFCNLNTNNTDLSKIDDNTKLFLLDNNREVIDTYIIACEKIKYGNACFPEMLQFIGTINCVQEKIVGSSGSPVFDNNGNIYGFLSGKSELLNITPMFFIKRIIKEIDKFNVFHGFCKLYCDIDFCKIGTFVKKPNNINYNIYCKSIDHKTSKLLKDDILIEFDGKTIHEGNIYCDEVGIPIDLDSYIMITKTINDLNYIKIKREKNKTKIFNIIIGNRDIYSSLDIDIRDYKIKYNINNNRIYVKINPDLFKLITKFRNIDPDDKILTILNPKISNLKSNSYLLVEDLTLKTNIFNCKLPNYIIK